MNELKNLLALSRNALQVCYYQLNMDFEKPFTVIEGNGKFTANSIGKKIFEVTGMTWENCKAALYLRNDNKYRSDYTKLYFVKYNCDFDPVDTLSKTIFKHEYIDDFWRKSDFEAERKKDTAHWWIIAQNKQYLRKKKELQPIDFGERYKRVYSECYSILGNDRKRIKYSPCFHHSHRPTEKDILDKSGYIRWENVITYQSKAKALKAEREKAAASLFDCSEATERIGKALLDIRDALSKAIKNNVRAGKIRNVLHDLEWIESDYNNHCSKIEKNTYSSIEDINISIDNMIARINRMNADIAEFNE